jgi:hypothetical protein
MQKSLRGRGAEAGRPPTFISYCGCNSWVIYQRHPQIILPAEPNSNRKVGLVYLQLLIKTA